MNAISTCFLYAILFKACNIKMKFFFSRCKIKGKVNAEIQRRTDLLQNREKWII